MEITKTEGEQQPVEVTSGLKQGLGQDQSGREMMAQAIRDLAQRVEDGEYHADIHYTGREGRSYTIYLRPVWIFEDELPDNITDSEYRNWFEHSRVADGVRVGPLLMSIPLSLVAPWMHSPIERSRQGDETIASISGDRIH